MADQSSFLVPILQEMVYGIDAWKKPAKVVATSNLTLTGLQTVDGVALAAQDEVLCVGQSSGAQNGIWVVTAGAWTRRFDASTSERLFEGVRVPITRGTAGAGSVYRLTTTGKINVGTTAQTWELDSQGAETSPEAVAPTPDTLALRGSAGEVRAVRIELADARILPGDPTQAGDLGFTSTVRRPQAWNPGTGAAEPVLLQSDIRREVAIHRTAETSGMETEWFLLVLSLPASQRMQLLTVGWFQYENATFTPPNTATVEVRAVQPGGGFVSLASEEIVSTAEENLNGFTISEDEIPPGYCLYFQITKGGSGCLLPKLSFFVAWTIDPTYVVPP
jgi:hypothetical protein